MKCLDKCCDEDNKSANEMVEWIYRTQIYGKFDDVDSSSNAEFGFRGSFMTAGNYIKDSDHLEDAKNEYDIPTISQTYSALCVLLSLGDDLTRVKRKEILQSVKECQREDGGFVITINFI